MVGGPYNEGCARDVNGCAGVILALVAIAAVVAVVLVVLQRLGVL